MAEQEALPQGDLEPSPRRKLCPKDFLTAVALQHDLQLFLLSFTSQDARVVRFLRVCAGVFAFVPQSIPPTVSQQTGQPLAASTSLCTSTA